MVGDDEDHRRYHTTSMNKGDKFFCPLQDGLGVGWVAFSPTIQTDSTILLRPHSTAPLHRHNHPPAAVRLYLLQTTTSLPQYAKTQKHCGLFTQSPPQAKGRGTLTWELVVLLPKAGIHQRDKYYQPENRCGPTIHHHLKQRSPIRTLWRTPRPMT